MVKRLSAMQETRVRSLGWEYPLEKEMAAHSNIRAWKIPWMVEPGRLLSMGSQRVGHDWATSLHFCQINNGIFHRLRQIILKFVWKHKTTYPEKKTNKHTKIKKEFLTFYCLSFSHYRVRLFTTPWTAACQASPSFTISWSLLKLMSIESVMPSNHLILCHPLLLLPSVFPASGSFPMSRLFALGGQEEDKDKIVFRADLAND